MARRLAKSTFKCPQPDESRKIAFALITQVNREGAYANIRLPELLAHSSLDERDRAFATELAYGTLRMQGKHDFFIQAKIDRPFSSLDPDVVDLLRIGIHQIFEMRVPDHAAVAATVELARAVSGEGKGSYINAILRSILRDPPSIQEESDLSISYSHPSWIINALRQQIKDEGRLIKLLESHNAPVAPHLVAWPGKSTKDELLQEGALELPRSTYGAIAQKMPGSYLAIHERRAGVQDLGSQLISEIFFNTSSGEPFLSWLDMCAGPGGKAALLYNLLHINRVKDTFCANEPTAHRAELVSHVIPRDLVISFKGQELPQLGNQYDRILIDAPCSGLGALRRRPESRWRKSVEDLKGLVSVQRELLDAGAALLSQNGIIAYVTCSPHRSETQSQVADFLYRHQDFTLLSIEPYLPGDVVEMNALLSDGTLQLWSDLHGTDSMFMALFKRSAL